MPTTIQVSERLKRRLQRHKEHPRQTYEEVIAKALDLADEDEFELSDEARARVRRGRRQLAGGQGLTTDRLLRELGL